MPAQTEALGQLNLPDVFLRNGDGALADLPGSTQEAGNGQRIGLQHHGQGIQNAGAADSTGRSVGHGLIHNLPGFLPDKTNGPGLGRHAAVQSRTLKGRACRSGTAQKRAVVGKQDLSVCSDICQNPGLPDGGLAASAAQRISAPT